MVTIQDTISDQKQGFFYMCHPTDRIENTTAFGTPVVSTGWNKSAHTLHQTNPFILIKRKSTILIYSFCYSQYIGKLY